MTRNLTLCRLNVSDIAWVDYDCTCRYVEDSWIGFWRACKIRLLFDRPQWEKIAGGGLLYFNPLFADLYPIRVKVRIMIVCLSLWLHHDSRPLAHRVTRYLSLCMSTWHCTSVSGKCAGFLHEFYGVLHLFIDQRTKASCNHLLNPMLLLIWFVTLHCWQESWSAFSSWAGSHSVSDWEIYYWHERAIRTIWWDADDAVRGQH